MWSVMLRLPLFKLVILGVSKLMVQVMWGCPTVGEASGCGVGLPSILIVGVGLCLTALLLLYLAFFLPLFGRPLGQAPTFLRWLSTLALPTQCFCFSALCSGPLRSLSLSARKPPLCYTPCALIHGCRMCACVDGRVGWSHTFTHFIFIIYFISMRYQTSFDICTAIL